jgi:glutamyl-tRNA reductase
MAGVLLHTPMVRAREMARAGEQVSWIDGLEALFGVVPHVAAVSQSDAQATDAAGPAAAADAS